MERVAVTGMGLINCLGQSLDVVSEGLRAGRCPIVLSEERKALGFRSGLVTHLPSIDFRAVFTYDHERGLLIRTTTGQPAGVKFPANKPSHKAYGYVKHGGKEYAVHRVVWAVVYGTWPETSLDHIDHDKRNLIGVELQRWGGL